MEYPELRVLMVGSPKFSDVVYAYAVADKLLSRVYAEERSVTILSGGSRGDRPSEQYAMSRGIKLEIFPSDWEEYGTDSGKLRCDRLIEDSTHLIAFWDSQDERVGYLCNLAKENRLQARVFKYRSAGLGGATPSFNSLEETMHNAEVEIVH